MTPIFHRDDALILCGDQDISTIEYCINNNYKQTNMDESITEHVYETRGYDRGFTAGKLHAHELLNNYIQHLKQEVVKIEEDWPLMDKLHMLESQIHALDKAKLLIRQGHWTEDIAQS